MGKLPGDDGNDKAVKLVNTISNIPLKGNEAWGFL